MRKNFLALVLFCFCTLETYSSDVINNEDLKSTTINSETTPDATPDDPTKGMFSVDLGYHFYDNGKGYQLGLVLDKIYLGFSTGDLDENESLRLHNSWNIVGGYNYRYYFNPSFFFDGKIGIGYYKENWECVTGTQSKTVTICGKPHTITSNVWEKQNMGNTFFSLEPKIGVRLFHTSLFGDICATASYRFDFLKFKFNKDYTYDYFTLGLSLVL